MVDKKHSNNNNTGLINSPGLLSDETIDELGYARFTAASDAPLSATQPTALSVMVVTGPTKSPPPVLMPRPRPAIHPTLQLTNAFANQEPVLSPTSSPSMSLQDEYPDQPRSTYLTPPLAPILKPIATPTPGGLSGSDSTTQQQQQQQQQSKEEISPQLPLCGTVSPTTPSLSPNQHVISASSIEDNSDLNHHQISSKTGMATQQQVNQSEEQGAGQNQHPSTATIVSTNDDVRPHVGVLTRKPGVIALTASTSAPLVPSPLVKSTLASQLSSSSSSSSGSEQQQNQQKQQIEKDIQQQNQSQQEQQEQQHRPQRRLRKSLSTEQLPKSGRPDFQHSDFPAQYQHYHPSQHVPLPGGNRPSTVEKLIYSSGGKSTLQQLQQEYLLRQNGYLRRQVDALKFDNMESQRQQQELATRMKQLEIQLFEEKKRQTPQQQTKIQEPSMTANEYQHHHYYHHNVFAPLPPHIDNYQNSDDDKEQDVEQKTDDGWERRSNNDTTTKKRQGNQSFETVDDNLPQQQQQQRSHNEYRKSMEGNLPEDKHYMERHHGISPSTGIATTKQSQQHPTNPQKQHLLNQRRHSSHITPIPSTSDSGLPTTQQQQQPRQRHVTAPSMSNHYRDRGVHGQKDHRELNHQRSRSVPKNEHFPPSSHTHWRQQQGDRAHRGKPIYFDDNNDNPPRHHHRMSVFPPQPQQQDFEEDMDMESDDELVMAPGTGLENEDEYYYHDDDDDDEAGYLDELDYYRYHMTTAPGPPMMHYPPPPPPDVFSNDLYTTMPPIGHPPLPLYRRKSASTLRSSRAGPQGFMDVMNPDHYERPIRPPMRRNWNNPQANQLRQMHMIPPSPRRRQQQHQHEQRGYRMESAPYGSRQRGHPPPPPPTTMSIAPPPPRSVAAADHHLSRKVSAMASPRMTAVPLRRPIMTRGSSIGSYPGRV